MHDRPHPEIAWRDLQPMTRWDTARELLLPVPMIILTALAASLGYRVGVVFGTFACFMLLLRVIHGAYHGSVGLRGAWNDAYMCVVSVLLGGSMHAIGTTHRYHHRHPLEPGDIEGEIAHHGFWSALWRSPIYPLRIHWAALRIADTSQRRWILFEIALVVVAQAAIWMTPTPAPVRWIALTMLVANAIVPMVGIWSVHAGCDRADSWIARTSRWGWVDRCFAHMFFHLEHHLYPAVPACRLHVLAQRLDCAAPFPVPTVHPRWHPALPVLTRCQD
jgi:fatty acid desaturase